MPKVMWWMWRPPGVMFRNGPRSALIAWVMAAHRREGHEEGAGGEQLALLAAIAEVLVVQRAQVPLGANRPLACWLAGDDGRGDWGAVFGMCSGMS